MKKKLTLSQETIRILEAGRLEKEAVAGGGEVTSCDFNHMCFSGNPYQMCPITGP